MVYSPDQLRTVGVRNEVEGVGNSLRCDITLFDISGRMAFSTTPEVYERMVLGQRLDQTAFYNIVYANKRFFLQKEKVGRRSFYSMYAPVFNSNSDMIAILSAPFTDTSQNFEAEAVRHIATVITIFLLLLLADGNHVALQSSRNGFQVLVVVVHSIARPLVVVCGLLAVDLLIGDVEAL